MLHLSSLSLQVLRRAKPCARGDSASATCKRTTGAVTLHREDETDEGVGGVGGCGAKGREVTRRLFSTSSYSLRGFTQPNRYPVILKYFNSNDWWFISSASLHFPVRNWIFCARNRGVLKNPASFRTSQHLRTDKVTSLSRICVSFPAPFLKSNHHPPAPRPGSRALVQSPGVARFLSGESEISVALLTAGS